jgi:hypothetical protein
MTGRTGHIYMYRIINETPDGLLCVPQQLFTDPCSMLENTEQDGKELLHPKRDTPPFRYRDQAVELPPNLHNLLAPLHRQTITTGLLLWITGEITGLWVPRTRSRHATCTYSCTRPPSRSRRSGRSVAPMEVGECGPQAGVDGARGVAGASCNDRCTPLAPQRRGEAP